MGVYTFKPDQYSSHMKIINYLKSLNQSHKLKVLDVGCSKGFIAKSLQNNNFEFYGIEYNKQDAKEARKYYKELRILDLDKEKPRYKGQFDIIIMADIIEHLKDSIGVVKHFTRFLRKDGLMVISTANVANIYVRLKLLMGNFDYEQRGIMDRTHLRFFTLKTFRKLAKESNLKIIKEDFTPIPLPMVHEHFSQGRILNPIHKLNYHAAKAAPKLLSFQFILYCKKD